MRPDRRSALRFASLRWAALPIVDRRWTVPMAAVALGFGLFVGVAIGPGTEGSLGTPSPMVVQVPAPDSDAPGAVAEEPAGDGSGSGGSGGGGGSQGADSPFPDAPTTPTSPSPTTTPSIPSPSSTSTYPSYPTYPTTPSTSTTTTTDTGTDTATTDETTTELGTALTGTVVHVNPKAASYTIATEDRRLVAIHSNDLPDPGEEVSVQAQSLANGTYDEEGDRERDGHRNTARFTGTVSYRDPAAHTYTVSAAGVSVLVRGPEGDEPPNRGQRVEVQGLIADGPKESEPAPERTTGCGEPPHAPKPAESTLRELDLTVTDEGTESTEGGDATDLEGIVEGVCREDRKLIVSADDVRESGVDLTLAVPDEISMGELEPGQVLRLAGLIHDNGSYEVTGLASDERAKGADDEDLIRGDL